jgi:hypothetical protein
MVEANTDLKVAVLKQSGSGGYELLLSGGRQRAFEVSDLPSGRASTAWSPDGNWLGLLRGDQVSILDPALDEVWTATLAAPPVCCWDRAGTRLLVGNADTTAHGCDSMAPAGSDAQTEWRVERRPWRPCGTIVGAEPADLDEVAMTEALWLPSPRGDLLVSIATQADRPESVDASRLVIVTAHAFASAPLAELGDPAPEDVSWVAWSADGNSVAWVCGDELRIWRYGCEKMIVPLRWSGSPYHLKWVALSPGGKHVLVVLTEYAMWGKSPLEFEKLGEHAIIVRVADGAATTVPNIPGVDIASWDSEDELHVAHDLQPEESGGYRYQWAETINIPQLPTPWSLSEIEGVVVVQPMATAPVLHQGGDYSDILPGLPEYVARHRVELLLTDPDTGALIGRGEFGPNPQASENTSIVVCSSETEGRLQVIGINAQSARIVPLLACEVPRPLPLLHLTVWPVGAGSGEQGVWCSALPVVDRAASFRCDADGVENIAIWTNYA